MANIDHDDVFEVFSILSKIIIFIPIAVIIVALVYKFNQNQNPKLKTQSQSSNLKSNHTQNNTQPKLTLDLTGPWVCSGKIDNLLVDIFIKDKKIKAVLDQKNKKENMVFNDGCYFHWFNDQYVGEKLCGLSSFVPVVETMISFGDLDLVIKQLAKLGLEEKIATNSAEATKLMQSCRKKNIDAEIFYVPANILFKNKK